MRRFRSLGVRRRHAASRALLRIARDLRAETAASGERRSERAWSFSHSSGGSDELEDEGEDEGEHSAYKEEEEDKEDKEEDAREYASYAAKGRCDGQPFHAHHPAATPAEHFRASPWAPSDAASTLGTTLGSNLGANLGEHFRAAVPFDAPPRTPRHTGVHTGSGAIESACEIVNTALSSPALSNAPDAARTPWVIERGSSRLNVATLASSADKPQDPHRSLPHRSLPHSSLRAHEYPTTGLDPSKYGNPDLEPNGPPTGTRLPTRLPERRGGASYPRPATRTDALRKSKAAKADHVLASHGNFAYRVVQD